jgi:hypothetical protein
VQSRQVCDSEKCDFCQGVGGDSRGRHTPLVLCVIFIDGTERFRLDFNSIYARVHVYIGLLHLHLLLHPSVYKFKFSAVLMLSFTPPESFH